MRTVPDWTKQNFSQHTDITWVKYFTDLDCILPVGSDGTVRLAWDGECLEVTADAEGGVLELGEEKISLVRGETRRVKI